MRTRVISFLQVWWDCAFSGKSIRETITKICVKLLAPAVPAVIVQLPFFGNRDLAPNRRPIDDYLNSSNRVGVGSGPSLGDRSEMPDITFKTTTNK